MRPLLALVAAVAASAFFASAAYAQDQPAFHPTKTVTIIVPYTPGGGTDAVGRLMATALEEMWGQTVIIDHRTGGNGSVGSAIVARAPPDGHTMVLAVSGIAINAHLMKLPYETETAFAPVTAVAYPVSTLIATPDLPANDLRELAAPCARKGPQADLREFRNRHAAHRRAHLRAGRHQAAQYSYKGAAAFVNDIAAGRVDTGVSSVTSALALINAGRLKSLGIMGTKRLSALPNVATFREQGFGGLDENSWYGLFAPAGTPAPVVEAIQQDIAKVLARPAFQAKLVDYGALPGGDTPAAFTARFQRDLKEHGETIRRLGITAD